MKIEHTGIVRDIKKKSTGLWSVEVSRTETGTKGSTIYTGIKTKPKLKVGQKIFKGEEI